MLTRSLVLILSLSAPALAQVAPAPTTMAPLATAPQSTEPKLYDEQADAKAQIAAAVAKAKKENRRVLIQWGGNWCPWCIRLHQLTKSDKDIAKTLNYEYDYIAVDCGRPDRKNMALAASYGANIERFPFLTILDADGKTVVNQDTVALELKDDKGESVSVAAGHDPKKVLAFLKTNAAKPLDAQAQVDSALAEAKKTGKLVFLHFGAPWCGWCHKLEDWMARPDIAPILDKGFINLKIDDDRMTGASDVKQKFKGDTKGGIPWIAFLDAEGKVLVTGDAPKTGNIGFPSDPKEVDHFADMLKKATKLSSEDQQRLIESLKTKPAKG